MLNKRPDSSKGKRVRTPITTSYTPKNPGGDKEPKVASLFIAGGLAVFAVLVIAVLFLSFARGDKPAADLTGENKTATAEEVMDAVYLSLFTYGLDKNSIKEKTEVASDDLTEIKLLVDPLHIETVELKNTLKEKLSGLNLVISEDEGISAVNEKVRLFIEFIADTPQKIKPNSVAIVIDDCGYSLELAARLAAIPYPVTFAILPHLKYSAQTAEIARKAGKTVFLHQPMQPVSYPQTDPGKGAILLNMPESLVHTWLDNNVNNIGKIDGFNNHMGSAVTQDSEKMKQIFARMKKYTDTFLDSYTSKQSVALDECKAAGFNCGLNRKFIDNESDYSYIRSKIIEGVNIARTDGHVIMIGHLHTGTVEALEKILPELVSAGYNIVPVTELTSR
jgi:polysaccharide deacetylase 2 family uncharacterized protein YibQ